jgi:hypothetical protein
MEPNTINQPPVQPTPVVPTAQPQPAEVVPLNSVNPIQPAGKSKTGLIIGVIAGVIVMLILAVLFFVVLSPKTQSLALAQSFMTNMTKGNVDKAVELTGDTSTKAFLTTAAAKLKGQKTSIAEKQYNATGESYYLFDLTGGSLKYARVSTEKENGKRVVMSLVYSADTLTLVPGSSSTKTAASDTEEDTTSTTACLVKSDFDTIVNANNGGNGPESIDYSGQQDMMSSYYNKPAYFLSDSLSFDTQSDYAGYNADVMVKSFATFYKTHSDKKFTIKLQGVVATTAAADLAFGTQRADKIKSMLVSEGVPSESIEVLKSENISTYAAGAWAGSESDPLAKRLARSVSLYIVPEANCSSTTTSSGTGR